MPAIANRVFQINRTLAVALGLAFVYHGALLLTGTFKRTYDAYVHIFFADHYSRSWFDTWDYRWYTGFTVTSYPPGAQQAVALLAKQIGLLNAYAAIQLAAILLLIVGVYRFSRMWVSEEAAGYAALIAVFSTSIAETVHVFGQLPTIFSLGFLLNTLPYLKSWLETARWRMLFATLIGFAATTAGHHVTTLFGSVFFAGPVVAEVVVRALRTPRRDEPGGGRTGQAGKGNLRPLTIRRLRRILPVASRTGLVGAGIAAALFITVLPYWLWSASDPITQIPIPHASRDSYISNTNAGLIFWLIPWGLLLLALPYALYKGLTTWLWPLAASLGLLTLLGTGGTTPLPKLLLGPAYEILTLDRFTFWATIAVLPFAGELAVSIRRRGMAVFLRTQFGPVVWRGAQAALALGFLASSMFVTNLTQFRAFQPAALDVQPIVNFINKDQHWRWRYLALGFGDQMAWLSANTTATTVDGNYHSARRLPELTTTPIERLEGAKYSGVPGIGSLQQFLAVPEKYNLKYVFSNDQFYDPLLYFSGWHRASRLENGVVVWEREDIPPLPEILPRQDIPDYQRIMWGIVPMSAILLSLLVFACSLFAGPLLTFARFLGLKRCPNLMPFRLILYGWWLRIDRRLRGWSIPELNGPVSEPRWQVWVRAWERIPRLKPPSRRVRWVNSVVALGLVIGVASAAVTVLAKPALGPAATVEAYFDDLDFRRYDDAYGRLDPGARPSMEGFLAQLTNDGGLLASYAKLNAVDATVLRQEANYALVQVDLDWVTSLADYPSTEQIELIRVSGTWYLAPDGAVDIGPPDRFFREPTVDYRIREVPRTDAEEDINDFPDIQDRPELEMLSARLVTSGGTYRVVGEVMNLDVDPADITVTAVVYDAAGAILTEYNAQTVAIHKLLPKEVTPFRIDFEGVAGTGSGAPATAIEFEPAQSFPVDQSIWERAATIQVYAKAVVTGRDLYRDVAAQALTVSADPEGGYSLDGQLVNYGTIEALVPHLLVTYYDAAGQVVWVDEVYLPESIRPQRTRPISVPIPSPDDVQLVMPIDQLFANGLATELSPGDPRGDLIPLPPESGFAAARVSVNYLPAVGI